MLAAVFAEGGGGGGGKLSLCISPAPYISLSHKISFQLHQVQNGILNSFPRLSTFWPATNEEFQKI